MHCGRALRQQWQQQKEDECRQEESGSVATSRQQYIKVQEKHIDECCQAEHMEAVGCLLAPALEWNRAENLL